MYLLHVYRPPAVSSTIPVPEQPSTIRQVAESFSPADAPTSAPTADADGTDIQSKEEEATVSLQDSAEFSSAPYSSFERANHALSVNQSQPLDVPETPSQQQQDGTVNHIPNSMVWLHFLISINYSISCVSCFRPELYRYSFYHLFLYDAQLKVCSSL